MSFPLKIAFWHGAIWTPWSNTWFLGPTRVNKPNGTLIGSAIFAQLTAECWRHAGRVLFPKNCTFTWSNLEPHLIHGSFGSPNSKFQTPSRLFQLFFLQSSWQRVAILYNGLLLCRLIIAPFQGDLNLHLRHGSLGPPKPKWDLDRLVTIGCICVHSTAMRPNNNHIVFEASATNSHILRRSKCRKSIPVQNCPCLKIWEFRIDKQCDRVQW